jgi:hypothetical protein
VDFNFFAAAPPGGADAGAAANLNRSRGESRIVAFTSALKNEKNTIRPPAEKKLTEEFTVASLYNYWVKMYMRRKARS